MAITNAPRSSGFTLVELVMVIILIGVLSALGVGLFAGRSAFSPLLATQQLESATLLAQQAALAGNEANEFSVIQDTDDFIFKVGPGTPSEREFQIGRHGTTLDNPPTFPITFDSMGRPETGEDIQFTFSGDSTFKICLSSLGAVYRGSCGSL